MKRFEALTEEICNDLKQDITELITPLAVKHGIELKFVKEKLSKDADNVAINICFSIHERQGSVATLKEEQDFKTYAEGFGMQSNWLGKEFKRGNFNFTVVGLMINAPKRCVVLQRSDGSRHCEDGKLVSRYLG